MGPGYRWVVLSNTTVAMLMATLNMSSVMIAMPAIFRGIHLDPLGPGNFNYLLWMLMGYMVVTAVLVVNLGRLGDMFGRVRMYNLGFLVFTVASILLSLVWSTGPTGALELIGLRMLQALGGAMLMANTAALLTDAFPEEQRGLALGLNQVVGLAGTFIGLIAGGLLARADWRLVFVINVPVGVFGTVWSYWKLRELGQRTVARIDWRGNLAFAAGLTLALIGITYGIRPYGGHTMGWQNPFVLTTVAVGVALLVAVRRDRAPGRGADVPAVAVPDPPVHGRQRGRAAELDRPRRADVHARDLAAGNLAAPARLQLRAHTAVGGHLHDPAQRRLPRRRPRLRPAHRQVRGAPVRDRRHAARRRHLRRADGAAGQLLLLVFALVIFANGVAFGLFAAPNTTSIMNSVPARYRGVASGMRATFQNAGMPISIAIFFSLMIIGLTSRVPHAMLAGLTANGVPAATATRLAHLPPVGYLFAAFLGSNPLHSLLGPKVLAALTPAQQAHLTGRAFFPSLISAPFKHGLMIILTFSIVMCLLAAWASWLRGAKYIHREPEPAAAEAAGHS